MLYQSFRTQFIIMLHRKSVWISFYIVLLSVLINFLTNVITYQGTDIINMVHPMQLLLLSDESGMISFYFIQLYPLLVVFPAGFSFIQDRDSNIVIFQIGRSGRKNYFTGKLLSAFFITFLVFTIPLFLEIILNCISFPLKAAGNLDHLSIYDPNYIETIKTYLWSSFFIRFPYLYAVFCTLMFGLVSGVLAVFTIAISTFPIKYKILLFIPVWTLLNCLGMIKQLFPQIPVDTTYNIYLQMYDSGPKSELAYLSIVCSIALISICLFCWNARKDWLQ